MRARTERNNLRGVFVAALLCLIPASGVLAEGYETPRTPWGHPDLQGTFTNGTQTPFERPEALGDKAFLTEEELSPDSWFRSAPDLLDAHSIHLSISEAGSKETHLAA